MPIPPIVGRWNKAGLNRVTKHITPWMPGYMTSQLLGGQSEVVITSTGHIQTMVNPHGKPRARYFAAPAAGPDPEQWMAQATSSLRIHLTNGW